MRRPRVNSDVSNESTDSRHFRLSVRNKSKQGLDDSGSMRTGGADYIDMRAIDAHHQSSVNTNPFAAQRREFVHPYANQPTPFEKV